MAERRMFAKSIIDSDMFLDMPLSTQALYFHLSMRADDEGFVNNPKKIQRMIGASDDDARILAAKSFIIPFDSGIVVIKHWKIHNYIRADRLTKTKHQDEKDRLTTNENGAYALLSDQNTDVSQLAVKCQSVGSQQPTKCQHRLGKDRLGKDSIDNPPIVPPTDDSEWDEQFEIFWQEFPRRRRGAKQECRKKYKNALRQNNGLTPEKILSALQEQKKSKDWTKDYGEYVPSPLTWLNQGRWEDEVYDGSGYAESYVLSKEDEEISI